MTKRALRIRHYLGTIVAVCSLGGLLLAFELAFLFQGLENRSVKVREGSSTLTRAMELKNDIADWLSDVRFSLGDAERLPGLEAHLSELYVQIEKLREDTDVARAQGEFDQLREELKDAAVGLRYSIRQKPGTEMFEREKATVLERLEYPEARIGECFRRIEPLFTNRLQATAEDLSVRRAQLWRVAMFSAVAYALLVLVLWRWAASRLLGPLQALTRESRRISNAETSFQLRPDGPHEVRLLNESISTLVGNLVGARAHLEEKVKERTLELERAGRAKNEFLANMSHEIRTPMTAILGYAELCLAQDIPETERRRYAEIIHTNGEHLLSVINDILDVSKIEAGRMTVEPTLCSPFDVVSEVRSLMQMRAEEKGLEVTVENRGSIPELIRTDPTRLRQILLNLLNNAIKFTDSGSVVLRFGMEPVGQDKECLAFEVQDTGVGLSGEQLDRIFRPFVQADTSTTRKYGGSGLGLTISQTLARLLGGDLTGTSVEGQGSTFRVTIDPGPLVGVRRLDKAPPTGSPLPSTFSMAGPGPALRGNVLLAEDVAVNRRLISTILRRAGIRVEEAENGRIALEKSIAAREAGQLFDIIFMDMQMPEMDGYEATRNLRAGGYLRPIVALTSHSMSGEKQRCLDAGCDEYMTKPIDRLALLQVLSRFLSSDEPEHHLAA